MAQTWYESCSICVRIFPKAEMHDLGGYEGEPPAWNAYPACEECFREETSAPEPQIEDSGDNPEMPF